MEPECATPPTIYVGDLPNSVDENFLRDFFGKEGIITNLTFNVNYKRPGKNSAYAFITYQNLEEAEKAVQTLNYTKIDGVPIRINIADPKYEKIRASGQGNIIIRNLDPDIDAQRLHEAFEQFGEIITCNIRQPQAKQLCYGYVQFKNPDDANEAISAMEGAMINGTKVIVELYNPSDNFSNIWFKTLPPSVTSTKELTEWFTKNYGESEKAVLLILPDQPDFKEGIISFSDPETTKILYDEVNGSTHEGVRIECERLSNRDKSGKMMENSAIWERSKYQKAKGRNLYVRNIPQSFFDKTKLKRFFEKFGEIESVHVQKNDRGVVGFIMFATKSGAENCIAESTLLTDDKNKQIFVSYYLSKDDRLKQFQFEKDKLVKAKKALFDRIISSKGKNSIFYKRAGELSDDQIEALNTSADLFQSWIEQ